MRLLAVPALVALALSGCGDDESAPPAPAGGGDTVRVAALGDSITSGSPGYDPDPAARQALGFGNDPKSQFEYWANRADPNLDFQNCGVFGERTDEIAARLGECATGADVLIVQGSINDIAQALNAGPEAAVHAAETAVENVDGMVASGQKMGLEVAVTDVLPWNNGHPYADQAIAIANQGIEKLAKRRGVPVIGFHDALEDPEHAGLMAPDLTADGDHPSVAGYRILGELVAKTLG